MASYGLVRENISSAMLKTEEEWFVVCRAEYLTTGDILGRRDESLSSSLPNISAAIIIFLSIKLMTKYEETRNAPNKIVLVTAGHHLAPTSGVGT